MMESLTNSVEVWVGPDAGQWECVVMENGEQAAKVYAYTREEVVEAILPRIREVLTS